MSEVHQVRFQLRTQIALKFRRIDRRRFGLDSFVAGFERSFFLYYLNGELVNAEISPETIAKIRALSAEKFESTFVAQLQAERKISMVIVYFMQEAYRRREWSKNFASFSSYCCEHLKMSSSDFYRKYSVLKTIEEIPEVESKILNGEINATTVAKISHFLHRESKSVGVSIPVETKKQLFTKLEGLSHRQVEKELASLSPQSALPDKTRQITQTTFVRQFTSNTELEGKIERAKELLAHTLPQPPTDCQVFTKITDLALERLDPKLRAEKREKRLESKASSPKTNTESEPGDSLPVQNFVRTKIPESVRNEVFKRDNYMCVHVNERTGKYCASRFALEIDHIIPIGHGGDHSLSNLRILCRTHNQLRALETYGRNKMETKIDSMKLIRN